MINFSKYDIVVVKFPFASSLKYKARPAVILSSETYNQNKRDTLIILAISSSIENKLDLEFSIQDWKKAGLLKPSILKSAIATIEKDFVVAKLGKLEPRDIQNLNIMIDTICWANINTFYFHHNLSDFTNYKLEFNYIKHPTSLKFPKLNYIQNHQYSLLILKYHRYLKEFLDLNKKFSNYFLR